MQLSAFAQSLPDTPYDFIVRQMQGIQADYPQFTRIIGLGKNDQGDDILGLHIENPWRVFDKSASLLVGTHHGNEKDAGPLSLAFARKVLAILQAGNSPEAVADKIYYIFPVLNISGHNINVRREQDADGHWHDPNRDYPDPCADQAFFKLRSTALLADFMDTMGVVSAVSVHGYIGTFTYPWGFYTEDPVTPDHDIYHELLTYAAQVNNYRVGNHKDVIYPASGSFEDWAYHDHGIWVALLEMQRALDYGEDTEALLRFFTRAPQVRSPDHAHYGQCMKLSERSLDNRFLSRP